MRSRIRRALGRRRGASAVIIAALLPAFIGFAALSTDTAIIAVARSQMSTAADAAALAGAMQLATEDRVRGATGLTTEITAANNQAVSLATSNRVLGSAPVVNANRSNQGGGQIMVGYLDPTNPSSTLDSSAASTSKFNSVQVKILRDAGHGGSIPTVFAQLMGFRGTDVTVSGTATAQSYSISGFQAVGSLNANLLPIVLDKTTWQSMLAGTGYATDQYTYNSSTNSVTGGADGIYESQLYPVSSGSPGNWGTIKVGVSNNSTSTLGAQIQYGITPAELATFPNSTIQLDTTQSPPSITFSGNPGISAGIKSALQSIIGKPVVVPIYDPGLSGGNGNNAWYGVIAFQPARILSVNFQGNPKYVIIQPCLINDRTAIAGTAQSWTSGGLISVQLTR
jgi:Flp pilus assembly protein TadG